MNVQLSLAVAGLLTFGIPVGTRAQNLFAAQGNYILDFTPSGTYSTLPLFLSITRSLAFDGQGNLFLTQDHEIDEYTSGGAFSTFASGLNPLSLAFNSAGTLFMGDGLGSIYEFTPSGSKSTFVSGFNGLAPTALAFNSAGDLFVGLDANGLPNSAYIDEITPSGVVSTFASGLEYPFAMAFNSAGDLFTADFNTGYIYEYAPNGARSVFTSGLFNPEGLAFNSAGDLFVSDSGSNHIYEYTPSGGRSTFATFSTGGPPAALAFQGETLPVPEPSVLAMLGMGILAASGLRFGRNS